MRNTFRIGTLGLVIISCVYATPSTTTTTTTMTTPIAHKSALKSNNQMPMISQQDWSGTYRCTLTFKNPSGAQTSITLTLTKNEQSPCYAAEWNHVGKISNSMACPAKNEAVLINYADNSLNANHLLIGILVPKGKNLQFTYSKIQTTSSKLSSGSGICEKISSLPPMQ